MIKINRFFPSKPFYEMTIEELQFVKLQNYKKRNNRKKRKRKTEDIITKIKHVKI